MNAIKHAGARPIPADIDPETLSLTADTVRDRHSRNTGAIINVHNFGMPADEPELYDFDTPLIEDISAAIGAESSSGQPVGSLGIAGVGSLYATKLIGAGFGGFITTDNASLKEEINDLKTYDERNDYKLTYNYALSDVLAAIGIEQLSSLDQRLEDRDSIATFYDKQLKAIPEIQLPIKKRGRIFYRYLISTEQKDELITHLQAMRIEAKKPVYKPLHRYCDLKRDHYSVTEQVHESTLLLPCHANMSIKDAEYVAECVKEFFDKK